MGAQRQMFCCHKKPKVDSPPEGTDPVHDQNPKYQRDTLQTKFSSFDTDGDGRLTRTQFVTFSRSVQLQLTPADINKLYSKKLATFDEVVTFLVNNNHITIEQPPPPQSKKK
eukprot:c2350_g1_i1.p1 GENE.c2350_g1_i1~~c2350_g1_i1.p1  ORF type:complete len:112 (-),score=30.73 c2350_g1_i1:12-347(-)